LITARDTVALLSVVEAFQFRGTRRRAHWREPKQGVKVREVLGGMLLQMLLSRGGLADGRGVCVVKGVAR
jgi:hypothetical protein